MRVYSDTNSLFHNVKRHANQPDMQVQLAALEYLLKQHADRRIVMFRSRVDLRELERTKDPIQQGLLRSDYEALDPVTVDERYYGQSAQITDPYGGSVSSPLVSDVQDEKMLAEIQGYGIKRRDAEHITQARSNQCDVFLTRDRPILRHRQSLEQRFPGLRIFLPSELVAELKSTIR